ncbi:MAG: hemolysin III family protein [Pirellulaceae bacterium]|jgi:hemolysin III|nr:hemolysin III family protein [Pirellulaceae bacterium]MDP6555057.1 hemolysin III family protein [Pirellulaceae bacterium]MDP6717199.1 hemolysin III family protein [Pirellulaceae bacterium]
MSQAEQTSSNCTEYLADQEVANAATHGAGFLLSVGATVYIAAMVRSIEFGLGASCLVYASTLMAVYAISTISHAIQRPRAKFLLRAWDQGVIYLLITGTYTPFVWSSLTGPTRLIVLILLWGCALTGFFSKVVRHHRVNDFSARGYIMLGWIPAAVLYPKLSTECLMWMVAGGVSYTVGTLFLTFDGRMRYFHAVWHVFVIVASACHYYAIVALIILPGTN